MTFQKYFQEKGGPDFDGCINLLLIEVCWDKNDIIFKNVVAEITEKETEVDMDMDSLST